MRDFIIYTKENCVFCIKAKDLMEFKGFSYIEMKIGETITLEEFKSCYPNQKTVPLILSSDVGKIGGYTELVNHLK